MAKNNTNQLNIQKNLHDKIINYDKCKWTRRKIRQKRHMVLFLWTLWISYTSLTSPVESVNLSLGALQGNPLLKDNFDNFKSENGTKSDPKNCVPPSILDFPPDLLTQKERQSGGVLIHFTAPIYIFYALAIVCDDYFVAAIERTCDTFQVPKDVAGATFMAIASSSPELFTNVISTFITEGDIGAGTIVGSAVFNMLAVCACCGFAAKKALPIDWYPLVRDSIFYFVACGLLIRVLRVGRIYLLEALIFVLLYIVYIGVMWKNTAIRKFVSGLITRKNSESLTEESALISQDEDDEDEESLPLFVLPKNKSCLVWFNWVVGWPARVVFYLTIPDCKNPRLRCYYPLTLIMSVVHIGILTYLVTWMMTVTGYTFGAPDSIMGLTFIAGGNSVPEAVSSIAVARQGHGSMSISNSIGSNTFDILMCLGLPWLIRTFMISKNSVNYVQINSGGLQYCAIFLMASVIFLFVILACNQFYLDRKVATISLGTYAAMGSSLFWLVSVNSIYFLRSMSPPVPFRMNKDYKIVSRGYFLNCLCFLN